MLTVKEQRIVDAIAILKDNGYIVRHKSEARRGLSWHRTLPLPDGVDFEAEALEKIRAQITPELLQMQTRPALNELSPAICSARLLVL